MIEVKGFKVRLNGSLPDISADVVMLLRAYREMLAEDLGEKGADIFLAEMGRAACADEEAILSNENLMEAQKRVLEALESE